MLPYLAAGQLQGAQPKLKQGQQGAAQWGQARAERRQSAGREPASTGLCLWSAAVASEAFAVVAGRAASHQSWTSHARDITKVRHSKATSSCPDSGLVIKKGGWHSAESARGDRAVSETPSRPQRRPRPSTAVQRKPCLSLFRVLDLATACPNKLPSHGSTVCQKRTHFINLEPQDPSWSSPSPSRVTSKSRCPTPCRWSAHVPQWMPF